MSCNITCPITQEEIRVPAKTPCNHIFEAEAIQTWLVKTSTCPCCRSKVESDNLSTNGNPPKRAATSVEKKTHKKGSAAIRSSRRSRSSRRQPREQRRVTAGAGSIDIEAARREWRDLFSSFSKSENEREFALLRAQAEADRQSGYTERMFREMKEDRGGDFAALRAQAEADRQSGYTERMFREMEEDRDGTFARLREEAKVAREVAREFGY